MRKIDLIVIHCSDSDRIAHDNVETIRQWHVFERGFSDIGYHYIITKNGQVCAGRDVHIQGAHVSGHNANSIGICLTGRHNFTDQQFAACRTLVRELMEDYKLRPIDVLPHNHLNKGKSCPNFNIYEEIMSQL
jgi:N-acetyl-anhydromuramyl-L-alanine amidase AmpD